MDTLTADVKKLSIKLKVPTPEENSARERKMAEEGRRKPLKAPPKTSRSPRKVSAGKRPVANTTSKAASRPPASSHDEPPLPDVSRQMHTEQQHAETVKGQVGNSLVTPDASSPIPVEENKEPKIEPATEEHRWNQNPVLSEPIAGSSKTAYANISPPLTPGVAGDSVSPKSMVYSAPASAAVTRQGLPVFMSHGPIPFAPSDSTKESAESKPEST
jgi:histone deacetylase HOS3